MTMAADVGTLAATQPSAAAMRESVESSVREHAASAGEVKVERDILKRRSATSRPTSSEVRIYRQKRKRVAHASNVLGALCLPAVLPQSSARPRAFLPLYPRLLKSSHMLSSLIDDYLTILRPPRSVRALTHALRGYRIMQWRSPKYLL
jgi:hypothetical protein